jgi:hypothetical protein
MKTGREQMLHDVQPRLAHLNILPEQLLIPRPIGKKLKVIARTFASTVSDVRFTRRDSSRLLGIVLCLEKGCTWATLGGLLHHEEIRIGAQAFEYYLFSETMKGGFHENG